MKTVEEIVAYPEKEISMTNFVISKIDTKRESVLAYEFGSESALQKVLTFIKEN